jgi:hypothetical protein
MSAIAEQVKPRKPRRLAAIVKLVLLAAVVAAVLLAYRHLTREHDLSTPNQMARALADGLRAAGPSPSSPRRSPSSSARRSGRRSPSTWRGSPAATS